MKMAPALGLGWLGLCLPAQDLLWQAPTPPAQSEVGPLTPFVDFDHDGNRDLLHVVILYSGIVGQQTLALEILSGATGQPIYTLVQPVLFRAANAGDMNGDGNADVLLLQTGTGTSGQRGVQPYSLATQSPCG